MTTTTQSRNWKPIERIAFRFFFIYFLMFIFTLNNGAYPFVDKVGEFFEDQWTAPFLWIGKYILKINEEIPTEITGSGDRTFDYVRTFGILLFTIIGTTLWSILDQSNYAN